VLTRPWAWALAGVALGAAVVCGWLLQRGPRPRLVSDGGACVEAADLATMRRAGLDGVVRSSGRSVAEAEVQLAGPSGFRTLRSGPDGAFYFPDLIEGRYVLRAQKEGLAAYLDQLTVGGADAGEAVLAVELRAGVGVAGRLLDRGGRPVDGGEVTLVEAPSGPLERKSKTGSDGRFVFDGVLPGGYVVGARADGYWPAEPRAITVAAKPLALQLRLERGATIDGRVVDESGKPIAGAQIEASGEGPDGAPIAVSGVGTFAGSDGRLEPTGELGVMRGAIPYPPPVPAPRRPTGEAARGFLSASDGRFQLIGLPAGKLVVAATHPDFARGVSAPVETHAGGTAGVTVTLRRGEVVRGRVVDDRGQPLAGVELADAQGTLAVTDGRGEFSLPHVDHELQVTAQKPGWLPVTRAIGPPTRDSGDWTLARAEGLVGGVVVDDRGMPVAGARVDVSAASGAPRRLVSDGRGRFRADGLPPGPYRLEVVHGDYAPARLAGVPAEDGVTVTLQLGGGIDGTVRDARTGEVPRGLTLELVSGARKVPLVVDRRGHFEGLALPTGKAVVSARAPGYVSRALPVDVPAAERPREITLRDVELELERGGSVAGRVTDADGDPVAGADVTTSSAHTRTDARGDYHLDGVAPGRVTVRAESAAHGAADEIEVRSGDESRLDLRLGR